MYRKIFGFFDSRERRHFYLLMLLMVAVAFAEIFGISNVFLLLRVLAKPEIIETNEWLSLFYDRLGFESTFAFQVFIAAAVFVAVVVSLAIKASGTYAIILFSASRGYKLSSRLLASYLHQPYAWFLQRNSAQIGKTVLSEVDQLVNRVIVPALKMLASVILAISIVGFLVVVDPVIALLAAGLLGGCYALIYFRLRRRFVRLGEKMLKVNGERFRVTHESVGGIKEVKLLGLEQTYTDLYKRAAQRREGLLAQLGLMSELPRYALEAITFATLLTLVLVMLLRSGGDIAEIIPTLGVFAFAVMRLLPSLQQIYHGLARMRSGRAVLDHISNDYAAVLPETGVRGDATATPVLKLDRELELKNVGFGYENTEQKALAGLDLAIQARTTVGIVGGTGAGKTTLVDLILGLLTPETGEIVVDGTPVTKANLRSWQKTLGYVPQAIYLTDDTIARNIAFGVPKNEIDMEAVERAARIAALHDFVVTDLPQRYDTVVGERGVRLSGGQRQRIGIARALYWDPSLLILDEATSALDNITERVVMEAVQNIRADKTIILIAHRLTTVRNCDRIFLMERGRLVSAGSYDELVAENETFREMAEGV